MLHTFMPKVVKCKFFPNLLLSRQVSFTVERLNHIGWYFDHLVFYTRVNKKPLFYGKPHI